MLMLPALVVLVLVALYGVSGAAAVVTMATSNGAAVTGARG